MKTSTSRAAAAALAGAMALTCASCGLIPGMGGAKTEDIVDAADDFAKALVSCNTDKIVKLTNEEKDSDAVEELEANLNGLLYSPEQDQIAEAVAKTIEYEIDEDSVEIKKEEASVDVTFTMVDYEAALAEGSFASVDDAIAAIEDCDDTMEVEITFEFALDDDEWLISNLSDKAYKKFYSFYGVDVSFTPDFENMIADSSIYGSYNYIYMVIAFTDDVSAYADGFTFDVFLNGQTYYSDMEPSIDEQYLFCDLTIDGPLDSGTYIVTAYYDGVEITSLSVDIDNSDPVVVPDPNPAGPDSIEGDVYLCYADCTDSFKQLMYAEGFDWEFSGTIGIWLELTLSDEGEYALTVDTNTFNADTAAFFAENIDQLMMEFYGTDEAGLEEYKESIGSDTYQVLEESLIQACISEYSADFTALYDYGTYTVNGDTIAFYSVDFADFEGTLDNDAIFIDTDDTSLNGGDTLEFYPEG